MAGSMAAVATATAALLTVFTLAFLALRFTLGCAAAVAKWLRQAYVLRHTPMAPGASEVPELLTPSIPPHFHADSTRLSRTPLPRAWHTRLPVAVEPLHTSTLLETLATACSLGPVA